MGIDRGSGARVNDVEEEDIEGVGDHDHHHLLDELDRLGAPLT